MIQLIFIKDIKLENHSNFEKTARDIRYKFFEEIISENSYEAIEQADGWTMIGNAPGVFAQHEHTVLVTSEGPMILTHMNGNW